MEESVSRGIVGSYFEKLSDNLSVDAAIVGGGPSGLVAAYYLARAGKKVAVFERKLAPGGGMWGGAMMFSRIVVQDEALPILDEMGVAYTRIEGGALADSVHTTAALIYKATQAGATIFNCHSVEDVVVHGGRMSGLVINWAPVTREKLHVDPLVVMARTTLDGTGHDCEVARTLVRKNGIRLNTPSGEVMGERSMSAEEGETTTVENTKEIYPGLYVSGMASNGVSGSFRMGPIFGGMLMSGKKVAELMLESLAK
ncbi:MAG: sulfide-dependent adenosine diphosphate thiazole synthase [Alistipes sp.]|nr:sulfide-dependent adenosine diphosphate thiazole synthase [Alistipes sp.]